MSKVVIAKQSLAKMAESQPADDAPVWSEGSSVDIAGDNRKRNSSPEPAIPLNSYNSQLFPRADPVAEEKNSKHRFGLPEGFVSRLNRYGRTVLFEDNVYRLPNGVEFIPQPPSGTLGSRNHRYALLTRDQYENRERGSVYVRADDRIFNYAFDQGTPDREIFDTGFTIHDLERTGQYAPEVKMRTSVLKNSKKKKRARRKARKGRRLG